jgi:hypothetical protein
METAIFLKRLEGPRQPFLGRARGLDIVVRIEEDGRRPGGTRNVPEHRRMGAGMLKELDLLAPSPPKKFGDVLSRPAHRFGWVAWRAYRWNPDKVGQRRL